MTAEQLEGVENMGLQMSGIIKVMKNYSEGTGEGGFGFITPVGGGKDIFFHHRTCGGGVAEFKTFSEGVKVSFKVQDSPKGPMAVDVTLDTSGVTEALASQTEDTVAWIIKGGAEAVDDNARMVEKLERFDGSIEAATKVYREQYGQDYGNIHGMIATIGYGISEGLKSDIVDLQVMFTGLQGTELSNKDTALFRELQSKFIEKSPEVQAGMLWFFELVNDYVISKSNDLSVQTNPLKNILFGEKNISYKQWIAGIFEGFEKDEFGMVNLLATDIRNAEAPQIGLKQFIRHLYDTKPEVMNEDDRTFLQTLYTEWPDEEVTNQPYTIDKEDKKERDRIAKKYVFEYSERGRALDRSSKLVSDFRTLVANIKD